MHKSWYAHLITAVQMVIDCLTILAGFVLAHSIWVHWIRVQDHMPLENLQGPFLLSLIILLFTFLQSGLYKEEKSTLNIEETEGLLKGVVLSSLLVIALSFFLQELRAENPSSGFAKVVEEVHQHLQLDSELSRWLVILGFFFVFLLMSIQRYIMFKVHQKLHEKGLGNQRLAIYGIGPMSIKLRDKIKLSPKLGYTLLGFIKDPDHEEDVPEDAPAIRVLGDFNDLDTLIEELQVEKLIIAMSRVSSERMSEIIDICEKRDCAFEFVPSLYALFVHKIQMYSIDGIPMIGIRKPPYRFFYRLFKRIFDLVVGGLFTLFIMLPIWFFVAFLIKRDSKGPVLFAQERVGENGKLFKMYKFRTMRTDTNPYAVTPDRKDDTRITRVGKYLRRTSIDEIPQLINVLKGDMSLVGPRPEMPFIVNKYTAFERERLAAKPGITGLWQISADRRKQIHDNMDYDLYYIEHQSLLLDIVILLRTIISSVIGVGAY